MRQSSQLTKKIVQKRRQVKNTEMKMKNVNKVQFASLNGKHYYLSDGIKSLPYGHPLLWEICNLKKRFLKLQSVIQNEKKNLFKLGNAPVNTNERLGILPSIFAQPLVVIYGANWWIGSCENLTPSSRNTFFKK